MYLEDSLANIVITAEEIDAALVAASKFGFCTATQSGIRPIQMEAILQAAFTYRDNRFNQELRNSHKYMQEEVAKAKRELENIRKIRRYDRDYARLAGLVHKLLNLMQDEWWLKAATTYHDILEVIDGPNSLDYDDEEEICLP